MLGLLAPACRDGGTCPGRDVARIFDAATCIPCCVPLSFRTTFRGRTGDKLACLILVAELWLMCSLPSACAFPGVIQGWFADRFCPSTLCLLMMTAVLSLYCFEANTLNVFDGVRLGEGPRRTLDDFGFSWRAFCCYYLDCSHCRSFSLRDDEGSLQLGPISCLSACMILKFNS